MARVNCVSRTKCHLQFFQLLLCPRFPGSSWHIPPFESRFFRESWDLANLNATLYLDVPSLCSRGKTNVKETEKLSKQGMDSKMPIEILENQASRGCAEDEHSDSSVPNVIRAPGRAGIMVATGASQSTSGISVGASGNANHCADAGSIAHNHPGTTILLDSNCALSPIPEERW
jgi:hypothetical protein